jgi:transcriptional regulator with XRE-family HTH domain
MSSTTESVCADHLRVLNLVGRDQSQSSNPFTPSSQFSNGPLKKGDHSEVADSLKAGRNRGSEKLEADNCDSASSGEAEGSSNSRLHRIAEVRQAQGISERSMCKRLNIDLQRLRQLEDPTRDLTLSELRLVQQALDVPMIDLLEDSNVLSRPIQERAKMVRIMKTAAAITECKLNLRAQRLSEMLREQLIELMPELAEVSSWPQFGSRRASDSVARVLAQEINTAHLHAPD